MTELYKRAAAILGKIDFGALWQGFEPRPFAFYDEERVWLPSGEIPWDERFMGNTSIEYEGGSLAIWRMDESVADADELAANLAHEMFHSFQQERGETRWPDDLALLDYPADIENHCLRLAENALLASGDVAGFIKARKYRAEKFGTAVRQELLAETIEGMAEYVGSKALSAINKPKFAERKRLYEKKITSADESFFDIRRMTYFTGALLGLALDEARIGFFHEIGEEKRSLSALITERADAERPNLPNESALREAFKKYEAGKKAEIAAFEQSPERERVEGDWLIYGYDPMNMIKQGGKILCSRFVILKPEEGESVFVKGPVLLETKAGSADSVTAYILAV